MEENKQKNSRKRLNSLILLVAFTAILLIVSTYAWFSTQKSVNISNLEGTVKVAEGLEVSLDAKNWSQEINFTDATKFPTQAALKKQYGTADHNLIPTELLPVSADGKEAIGQKEITFYRGTNEDSIKLNGIKAVSNDLTKVDAAEGTEGRLTAGANPTDYPGYYAIDLFLRNSSRVDADATGDALLETLQLNANSMVNVKSGGSASTGLQNTPRIALALYDGTGAVTAASGQSAEDYQNSIITATVGSGDEAKTIKDVAIWEPNANAHVDYIVGSEFYNGIKWTDDDVNGYLSDKTNKKFTATERIPTYALTAASVTATNMDNLYDWSGTNASLKKQIALQTDTSASFQVGAIKNLISVSSEPNSIYTTGAVTSGIKEFKITKNAVVRIRMYVWLEGQDPDCVNYASHGGGIEVDLGLIKGADVTTPTTPESGS